MRDVLSLFIKFWVSVEYMLKAAQRPNLRASVNVEIVALFAFVVYPQTYIQCENIFYHALWSQ